MFCPIHGHALTHPRERPPTADDVTKQTPRDERTISVTLDCGAGHVVIWSNSRHRSESCYNLGLTAVMMG